MSKKAITEDAMKKLDKINFFDRDNVQYVEQEVCLIVREAIGQLDREWRKTWEGSKAGPIYIEQVLRSME